MTEADVRFLEALEIDLAQRLGPRVSIRQAVAGSPGARSRADPRHDRHPERPGSFSEEGDSLIAVAAALLERSAEVRLAEGFREVLDGAFA